LFDGYANTKYHKSKEEKEKDWNMKYALFLESDAVGKKKRNMV
jgi:hypothetical protein